MGEHIFLRIHLAEWILGGFILGAFSLGVFAASGVSPTPSSLRGAVLIQAEAHGEAWYVMPESGTRLYLGTPREALVRMRAVGLPVTSETIDRIPEVGSVFSKVADDHIGATTKKYLGAILVRSDHEPYDAWYVHPITGTRYPLASPRDAFALMRSVALGVSDEDIARIPIRTLEEDRYPIAMQSLGSERSSIIPGRTSFSVSSDTIEHVETFARDQAAREQIADGYIIMSIDQTPVIVSLRYARWFILGPQGSADSFHLVGLLAGHGTLHFIHDSSLYGLYAPSGTGDDSPVFLIENGGGVSTLALGILATETRYPELDANSLSVFSDQRSPLFLGSLLVDAAHVYLFQKGHLTWLAGADRSTIQAWQSKDSSIVYGDTHGLYATDREGDVYRIPASDPLTITITSLSDAAGSFYIDPADERIRRAEQWDESGTQRIARGIVAKEGHVYIESQFAKAPIPLEGVIPSLFFSIPGSDNTLYSDGNQLYYLPSTNSSPHIFTLSALDVASFEFLAKTTRGLLVKDHHGIYTLSAFDGSLAQLKDVDAPSFRLLYADGVMLVAKDVNHVYAGDTLHEVRGADAASFHSVFTVEGIPFGRDRNSIYYALPRDPGTLHMLVGADPSSFTIYTIPAAEPALRTLVHQGTDRIVYATDRQWIWFYDGKRDGLLVIRRADQNEKVSDAQIIDFARMYANAIP